MPTINAHKGTKEVSIHAVVTRADGRVEDLGVISYWHASPWRRFGWRLGRAYLRVVTICRRVKRVFFRSAAS